MGRLTSIENSNQVAGPAGAPRPKFHVLIVVMTAVGAYELTTKGGATDFARLI
jgi:hypothetical protein